MCKYLSFNPPFVSSLKMQITELMQLQVLFCNLARHSGGKTYYFFLLYCHCKSLMGCAKLSLFFRMFQGLRLRIPCTKKKKKVVIFIATQSRWIYYMEAWLCTYFFCLCKLQCLQEQIIRERELSLCISTWPEDKGLTNTISHINVVQKTIYS